MKKFSLLKNHVESILTGLVLLTLIYFLFLRNFYGFYNSDVLSIVHVFKDLFWNHGHLGDWSFPTAAYFFPDIMVYSFFGLITKNLWFSLLGTYVLLCLLYYYFIVSIGTLVCGESGKNLFRLSALTSLLLAFGHFSDQEIFERVIISHFSTTVIMYLGAIFLVLKQLKQPQKSTYVALLLICFLTIYSDPLFFPLFLTTVFPALFAVKPKEHGKLNLPILLSVLLVAYLSSSHDWFGLHIARTGERFFWDWARVFKLREVFEVYYSNNPIICLMMVGSFFIGNTLFLEHIFSKKHQKDDAESQNRFFVLIIIGACINLSIFIGIFMDRNLMIVSYNGLRYFEPMVVLPIFLGAPVLLASSESLSIFTNRYYYCFLAAIFTSFLLFQPLSSPVYPPMETQCLDTYYSQGELMGKDGISDYWNARRSGAFSKNNLNVAAVNADLTRNTVINTNHDYKGKKFYFVLLSNANNVLTPEIIEKNLGQPQKKINMCSEPGCVYLCL